MKNLEQQEAGFAQTKAELAGTRNELAAARADIEYLNRWNLGAAGKQRS
jgi:hypothetical protein